MSELLRELAPQVLGAVLRRYRAFDLAEDAVQEALVAAALQWPRDGVPDNRAPRGPRHADGDLIPLDEQDRSRWDRAAIDEGVALISAALRGGRIGPYQLQAAIAAVHDEADWPQILALYTVLETLADNPVVQLDRSAAIDAYRAAAARADDPAERRYLEARAVRLGLAGN